MKKGFTLAEILIVLIIIGVVSLLTVPALVDLYKFRDLTARYQRIYSELTTAFTQAVATANYTDGTIEGRYYDDEDNLVATEVPGGFYATTYGYFNSGTAVGAEKARREMLVSYMGIKKCQMNWGFSTDGVVNCFSKQYDAVKDPTSSSQKLYIENVISSLTFSWTIAARTPWGASIIVYSPASSNFPIRHVKTTKKLDGNGKYYTETEVVPMFANDLGIYPTFIFVDTNGPKGPNVTGYDAFIFQVAEDGSLTDVVRPDGSISPSDTCGKSGGSQDYLQNFTGLRGCVTRVEENGGRVKKFTDAEINGG